MRSMAQLLTLFLTHPNNERHLHCFFLLGRDLTGTLSEALFSPFNTSTPISHTKKDLGLSKCFKLLQNASKIFWRALTVVNNIFWVIANWPGKNMAPNSLVKKLYRALGINDLRNKLMGNASAWLPNMFRWCVLL